MSKSKLNAWKSTSTIIQSDQVWACPSVLKWFVKKLAKQISWWDCVIPRVRLPGPASCSSLVTALVTIVTQEADNENHPVCCHCLRYQRVSAPPPGVNWSQMGPASHVWPDMSDVTRGMSPATGECHKYADQAPNVALSRNIQVSAQSRQSSILVQHH